MTYTKEQVLAILGKHEEVNVPENMSMLDTEYSKYVRNGLRLEQRKRLENMKPKKTREVIKYC